MSAPYPPPDAEHWPVEHCGPLAFEVPWGTPMPCCGCPLAALSNPDRKLCACRCHMGAALADLTLWRGPQR